MKNVKVSDLKKYAKKRRKNNSKIKNQSESLDLVANEYNKKNWKSLIDDCVLPLEDIQSEKIEFSFSNDIMSELLIAISRQMLNLRNMTFLNQDNEINKLNLSTAHDVSDTFHNIGLLAYKNKNLEKLEESLKLQRKRIIEMGDFLNKNRNDVVCINIHNWNIVLTAMICEIKRFQNKSIKDNVLELALKNYGSNPLTNEDWLYDEEEIGVCVNTEGFQIDMEDHVFTDMEIFIRKESDSVMLYVDVGDLSEIDPEMALIYSMDFNKEIVEHLSLTLGFKFTLEDFDFERMNCNHIEEGVLEIELK